jgi:hypothetical protein
MMKTCAVTLLLLLALLSPSATDGSPRGIEGALREKFNEDSMKINEMHVEDLERMLQEVVRFIEMLMLPVCDSEPCD